MPRFAANLTMLFTELPFMERFEAAARAGFEAVEYLFPSPNTLTRLHNRRRDRLGRHNQASDTVSRNHAVYVVQPALDCT